MTGNCDTPGHEDRPGRLYACGWRCGECAPDGTSSGTSSNNRESAR
jgi:hypothetical protein